MRKPPKGRFLGILVEEGLESGVRGMSVELVVDGRLCGVGFGSCDGIVEVVLDGVVEGVEGVDMAMKFGMIEVVDDVGIGRVVNE